MSVKIIKDDLFKYSGYTENNTTIKVVNLAHGINVHGAMGKGIAVLFKQKFPDMYAEYKTLCKNNKIKPGDCWVYSKFIHNETQGKILYNIFNLAIKDHWSQPATYDNLDTSIKNLNKNLIKMDLLEVAMPWVGCGLGELKKEKTEEVVKNNIEDKISVIIFEK
jgi:O-acetyl-ADP-ribose deacetylase (regulator of RNase III)